MKIVLIILMVSVLTTSTVFAAGKRQSAEARDSNEVQSSEGRDLQNDNEKTQYKKDLIPEFESYKSTPVPPHTSGEPGKEMSYGSGTTSTGVFGDREIILPYGNQKVLPIPFGQKSAGDQKGGEGASNTAPELQLPSRPPSGKGGTAGSGY